MLTADGTEVSDNRTMTTRGKQRSETAFCSTAGGLLILCITATAFTAGCLRRGTEPPLERSFSTRAGNVHIQAVTMQELDRATAYASNRLDLAYERLSLHAPGSEINVLNRIAGMVRLPLSPETYRLLQLAAEYHELSDGAFDITTAPFSYAWGFYDVETPEEPPAPEQLDALLKHIGMRHLKLDSRSAELTSQHTRIEVDQLLKAYALDMTILALQRYEVNGILVEIDGHARCIGEPPGGGPWHLPLRYTAATDSLLGTIALTNGQACASLHHDDRLITIGGKEYTRIIDPLTGWPVEKTQAVVTIGPTATKATALAKTLFALGADELGIARRFTHCEALIVPRSNAEDAFMTPGFRAQLDAATAPQINLHVVRE